MLNINYGDDELAANGDETDDLRRVETTVFELAGLDEAGLLAEVTRLLTDNGCDVRSAAVSASAARLCDQGAKISYLTARWRAVPAMLDL